jgi:hypothetical protein
MIAKEHGLTLGQYKLLPRKERYTLYLLKILASAKEKFAYDEAKEKSEREAEQNRRNQGRFRDYM